MDIQSYLDTMREQEKVLAAQLEKIREQLTMTRGAVQVLEHIIESEKGAQDAEPEEKSASK